MSHVRAEVLRVSRSRSGWREGNPKPNQRPYISSLKSTFEGSTVSEKPQRQEPPVKTPDSTTTKPQRLVGSKVSTIANMFQSMGPTKDEVFHARQAFSKPESPRTEHSKQPISSTIQSPERPKLDKRLSSETLAKDSQGTGGSVHLNRTESHLARFNNARAMFERLEEQSIRSKSVYSPNSMKRSGSVSPHRSSPSRATFSPTLFSRSPSPGETQSVGSSPKRDSPLSPREKSQSADSILGERNRENTATFYPSSHLNGRRHNLDLDLSCSGAGEAIISPGPLSPHLASYLAEDLLSNGSSVLPKCVLVDDKLIRDYESKCKAKPFPISPKPVDLNNRGTAAKTRDPSKHDEGRRSPPCSPRGTTSRSVGTSPSAASENLVHHGRTAGGGGHIPVIERDASGSVSPLDCGETVDERPMLISAVEKKDVSLLLSGPKFASPGSHVSRSPSDGEAIIPNGRDSAIDCLAGSLTPPSSLPKPQATTASSDKASAITLDDEKAAVVDGHGTLRLCSPKSRDSYKVSPVEEQSPVVEATNQQLLREVQGSLNRDLESGSQILVLSSSSIGTSRDALSDPVHVTLNGTASTDDDDDDEVDLDDIGCKSEDFVPTICPVKSTKSPQSISEDVVDIRNSSSEQLVVTPQELDGQQQRQSLSLDNVDLEVNRLSSCSKQTSSPSKEVESSRGYSENDQIGVSTQGTSPLSPKWDGDNEVRKELKVIIPSSPVNGDLNRGEEKEEEGELDRCCHRSEADEPEVMTPEEADRLLSSPEIFSDEEASEAKMLLRNNDDTNVEGEELASGCDASKMLSENRTVESVTTKDDYEDDYECPEEEEEYNGIPEEEGVHVLEDGHFWVEVPGLLDSDDDEVIETFSAIITPKRRERVKFSTKPIRVYSTFSVMDYDRRNDDVDPVSASAEYELEKRVEKMDVFPVELLKGPEGLGLSIIGMGVGADAGLEKLGIFIKTITEGGAAHKDGRIDVNDQIIEVDGKSLVGVTQAYAASVLRNTSGLVSFLIGREKDGENSEVAQLISQSLQADREREERRRAYEQELQQQQQRQQSEGETRGEGGYPGLTLPIPSLAVHPPINSAPKIMVQEDSTPEEGDDGPTCEVFDLEESSESPSPESDVAALRIKLKEAQYKNAVAGAEITKSKVKVAMLETLQLEREEYEKRIQMLTARLVEVDRLLDGTKKEVMTYQDMLEESQGQYIILEKKYYKAKKLIKECQQREQDLIQREEYHIQQLQEKDQEYNALVKSLKDRVIQLEQDLMETQRAAGLPVKLPYDNTSIKQLQLTPQQLRKPQIINQKKRGSKILEADVSDSELSDGDFAKYDISPDSDDNENKTSTVERKPPSKDDLFEKAVPQHELLDSTAAKTKAELASKGSLANRQPPSLKKAGSTGSSGDGMPFDLKDTDSSTSLGSSREDLDESVDPQDKTSTSASMSSDCSPVVTPLPSLDGSSVSPQKGPLVDYSHGNDCAARMQNRANSMQASTISAQLWKMSSSGGLSAVPSGRGSPVRIDDRFAEEMRIILERKNVEVKRHTADDEFAHEKSTGHLHTTEAHGNMTPSPGSTVSSQSSDSNTTGGSDAATVAAAFTNVTSLPSLKRESSSGCDRLCPQSEPGPREPPLSCCCLPSTAQTADSVSLEQECAPSNFAFKGSSSFIGDQSSAGFGTGAVSERRSHQWHSCSVMEWSSGQVGQWLLALSMEQYISMFMENNIGGQELLNMDGTKLKSMGVVNGNDRSILKKKVKDLKVLFEKERKAAEKEMKVREKLQKKAEKQAERCKRK